MSIFFPLPPPFIGGFQPHAPQLTDPAALGINANAPPYSRRTAEIAAEIVGLSQPAIWPYVFMGAAQPYAPSVISPGVPGQSVNPPPFSRRTAEITAEIVNFAQPSAWPYLFAGAAQPYAPSALSPGIPGQSVDPPPRLRGDLTSILTAWTQSVPAPQIPQYVVKQRLGLNKGYIIG